MRQYEDLLIDALLDHGFTVEEAESLIRLQERVERERKFRQQLRAMAGWYTYPSPHSVRDIYN